MGNYFILLTFLLSMKSSQMQKLLSILAKVSRNIFTYRGKNVNIILEETLVTL